VANPQVENGYTQIANEFLEILYKRNNLSPLRYKSDPGCEYAKKEFERLIGAAEN